MTLKEYSKWDGEYLVDYRMEKQYRYVSFCTSKRDQDWAGRTIYGEWRGCKENAAASLLCAGWKAFDDDYKHDIIKHPKLETRVVDIEVRRVHKSRIIRAIGRLGEPERPRAYGDWDLH